MAQRDRDSTVHNFTAAATDPDGDAISYSWNFGRHHQLESQPVDDVSERQYHHVPGGGDRHRFEGGEQHRQCVGYVSDAGRDFRRHDAVIECADHHQRDYFVALKNWMNFGENARGSGLNVVASRWHSRTLVSASRRRVSSRCRSSE